VKSDFRQVLQQLRKLGLLLESDTRLPSVATLFAGEPVRGSWWSHARAQDIFKGLNQLADHKDVLFTKLVSGKVTLVHRRLWPGLLSIAVSRERWQTRKLTPGARSLLRLVDAEGSVSTIDLPWPKRFQSMKIGDAVRELERRLLIHAEEFHSDTGAHAKRLERWQRWADRRGTQFSSGSADEAKQTFQVLLAELNKTFTANGKLPW
jgi:hypothetical protein